jgi:signal transduction histidine kinase
MLQIQSELVIGGFIILSLLVIFIILFISLYQKRYYKHLKEKQILQSRFHQELLQTQIEIQEQTLKTISQEIHDNVGQVLSLAKLHLGTFEDTESPANLAKINDTKQLVSKAINDLRDLSRSLYGNNVAQLGLPDAVDNELRILQNSGQFKTLLKISGETYKLEPQKEMVIFRILQESLNNTIKHSKAQNINVRMEYEPGLFRLTIADDGVGFDTTDLSAVQPGMGLKSLQSRTALIGGNFSVHSAINKGTSISIEIPTIQS